jgi:hypothetical protein
MESIFACDDVRQIDYAIWLSSPIFSRQKNKDCIYDEAVKIGKDIACKTPINMEEVKSDICRFGVAHIVSFSNENIYSENHRAYYLPEAKTIQYNDSVLEKLHQFCKLEKMHLEKQEVLKIILLHEFFHHLEEWYYEAVDMTLFKKNGYRINPIYREIAAFAFVNEYIQPIKCQSIDLVWLKFTQPNIFENLKKIYYKKKEKNE